jgi:tRNA pseudouridine55 synthase
MDGVLVVDKPKGMTSHDVVRRVRHLAGQRDVGHLGTLDPMATGVLPLVLGRFTRLAQFYEKAEKEYEGSIVFGIATDTYDAEGEVVGQPIGTEFSREQLEHAVAEFRGEIEQMPPPFSAKKIAGVPAYKLARKKQDVLLKPVRVRIERFEVLEVGKADDAELPESARNRGLGHTRMRFAVRVSSGTYVRSLAHDLGEMIGIGAFLSSLRRTHAAEFRVEDAFKLEELERKANDVAVASCLLPARQLLTQMPSVTANEEQMAKIRHGNAVNLPEFSPAQLIKVFDHEGTLVAIAGRVAGSLFQPKVVMVA